ncbi:MAG TPA: hypothetical protein PKE46_04970 [Micropruina sp.]|nr:hypothetical protein [Micropruina sp.]HMR21469.1 hypothetical protein [Micropruina sp.]
MSPVDNPLRRPIGRLDRVRLAAPQEDAMVGRRAWIALVSLALVGCGPAQPTATPSSSGPVVAPTPTFMCTPEAGGSSSPCTEREYREMQERDAMYAEAEQIYRRYLVEDYRVAKAGGATKLTPEFLAVIGGEKLRDWKLGEIRAAKKGGYSIRGGSYVLVYAKRLAEQTRNGSDVGLSVCVDARSAIIYRKGRKLGPSLVVQEDMFFKRLDGAMKMWTNANARSVTKC